MILVGVEYYLDFVFVYVVFDVEFVLDGTMIHILSSISSLSPVLFIFSLPHDLHL